MRKKNLVIVAAGGTGGHVMPAAALARDLVSRGYDVEWISDERGEKFKNLFPGIPHHIVKSGTLGAGLIGKVKGAMNLVLGLLQAKALISKKKPAAVVGFGGYPSFPAVKAAQDAKIPTVLHEQNAIIGRANLALAHQAERIASSVPNLHGIDKETSMRTVFTGNPVREEITALYTKPYPPLEMDGALNVFVMGGSLGAKVFSDVLPQALKTLPEELRARLHITQQCREEYLEQTQQAYEEAQIDVKLMPFVEDVSGELEKCHLFIGRSGASTVAEITAAGRPAIFVPYPHHKDQQQKMNADVVADRGGAWVMIENSFTPEVVSERIETILRNPSKLFKAAENARECAKPDAARRLGNLVTELVSGWGERETIVK